MIEMQTEEFLTRYSIHVDFVLPSINGDKNKRIFLQAAYDVQSAALRHECLSLTRNFIKNYQARMVVGKKNGWFVHEKTMRTLAVMIATDVLDSIQRRAGGGNYTS